MKWRRKGAYQWDVGVSNRESGSETATREKRADLEEREDCSAEPIEEDLSLFGDEREREREGMKQRWCFSLSRKHLFVKMGWKNVIFEGDAQASGYSRKQGWGFSLRVGSNARRWYYFFATE